MLDRNEIQKYLDDKFTELNLKIPKNLSKTKLVETFCLYTESDYSEWIRDNFRSFFNYGNPDWKWIRDRIMQYENE